MFKLIIKEKEIAVEALAEIKKNEMNEKERDKECEKWIY